MKIVILDRDGTLNELGDAYITMPEEWVARPGALEAVARINRAGWNVVVATNQPGLGRGMLDVTALNAIHSKMLRQLAALGARVDAVFYCPHVPDDACSCRKPAPGLLEQIAERYGVEPHEVRVVGNTAEHLQAGAALGARLHLICTGHSAQLDPRAPLPAEMPPGTQAHADLQAFADTLEAAGPGEAPRP